MSPDEDVASLAEKRADHLVPPAIMAAAREAVMAQDHARGNWPNPRTGDMPDPPWPAHENPILAYLFIRAKAQLQVGIDPETVVEHLLVHAWFEGGIENYDRGRHDAHTDEPPLHG